MILPISVEDVKREVKILHALTGHENVVQFHNAFEDDSFVYIVMEWVLTIRASGTYLCIFPSSISSFILHIVIDFFLALLIFTFIFSHSHPSKKKKNFSHSQFIDHMKISSSENISLTFSKDKGWLDGKFYFLKVAF